MSGRRNPARSPATPRQIPRRGPVPGAKKRLPSDT